MNIGSIITWELQIGSTRTRPLGRVGEPWSSPLQFPNQKGPTVSASNIKDIAFYGCLEIIRTRSFTIFTVYATSFGQFSAAFHFF